MLVGIVIAIIAVLLLASAVVGRTTQRRRILRKSFGPEYDTVAQEHDSRQEVDRELLRRTRLHEELNLHQISVSDQAYFATSWEHVQSEFLDDPAVALRSAGRLVTRLLDARGYPVDDSGEQLALLSVKHASVLADYRRARQISEHTLSRSAPIPTEELRQALMSYRALSNELLAAPGALATR